MKEPISGETISKNLSSKLNGTKKQSRFKSVYACPYCLYGIREHRKCGLYQGYLREWYRKQRLDKTWSNFKYIFARSFQETRRSSRNSNTKGYVANVQSAQANSALFTEIQQDHIMALSNIATATQSDRTSVVLLTKMIV